MKILVAEDDDVSRFMTVKAVQQLGYECIAASDGEQAWELYRDKGADTVISDWMMPGLDGIQLCKRIRRQDAGYTYFIILTALSEREYRLEGMRAGADDYLAKPLVRDELQLRLIAAQRVTALHRTLHDQAQELERLNREFFESGRVDALTGIANRLRMQEDLRAITARVERFGDSFCLALFDIDHFKKYNDTCGHVAGDEVLRTVARALASACRSGDTVYRYGGEEFLAILGTPSLDLAATIVDRMRVAVEKRKIPHPKSPTSAHVTVSAGVAGLRPGEGDVDGTLNHADAALFEAKQRGRNAVAIHGRDSSDLDVRSK
ncbi:MAG: diguanylate cyclase response regulator [Proteobacteria bacterium]|nr:MAG: diguanylate cyclase response regulator [Pseudomonadota bacterium]